VFLQLWYPSSRFFSILLVGSFSIVENMPIKSIECFLLTQRFWSPLIDLYQFITAFTANSCNVSGLVYHRPAARVLVALQLPWWKIWHKLFHGFNRDKFMLGH